MAAGQPNPAATSKGRLVPGEIQLNNVSAGRAITIDQRSYSPSIPQRLMLSLGWGPTPSQRLITAGRRLAAEVNAREAAELARLVGIQGQRDQLKSSSPSQH